MKVYGAAFVSLQTLSGTRREKSLAEALERSTERLVLVEGDPGAGKSVALRHVAYHLAVERIEELTDFDSTSSGLRNLKDTEQEGTDVDREAIREFVLDQMARINDRFVDEFLDLHFFDEESRKASGCSFLTV